jgi:hypothetical protein
MTGVLLACFGGGYFLSRKIYSKLVGRRSEVLHEVMEEMVDVLSPGTLSLPPS